MGGEEAKVNDVKKKYVKKFKRRPLSGRVFFAFAADAQLLLLLYSQRGLTQLSRCKGDDTGAETQPFQLI